MSLFRRQPPQPTGPAPRQPSAYVRSELEPAAPPSPPALHPAQVRRINWEEEAASEARQLPARRPSGYVPAASEIIRLPEVNLASPDANVSAAIQPFAQIEGKTLGSHQDRARAWLKYSLPLSVTAAAVMVVAAVALYDVPLLSFWALLIFGLTFVVAYSVLLRIYWEHTPEGVALRNTRGLWGYLRAEQAHRHGIEREIVDAQLEANRRRLGGEQ
jgi:hypothetical protein